MAADQRQRILGKARPLLATTQIPQKRRGRHLRRHEPDLNAEKYELEEHELTQAS